MITKTEYDEAVAARKDAEATINAYHEQEKKAFDDRLKSGVPFSDDELIYAAYSRCLCGHGIAYPKGCGINHYWDCSAILKGVADPSVQHTDKLPFAFYDVKSEQQPSANGNTTRGTVVVPKQTTQEL